MDRFLDLTLAGLTFGAIYSAFALALVLIWRSTRIVNFAQGGMLMITTFIGYGLVSHGGSYWLALTVAVLAGLILGAGTERLLIRPLRGRPHLDPLIVTLGLYVLLQGAAGMVFGGTPRSYPPAFDTIGFRLGGRRLQFAPNDLWVVLAVAAMVVVIALVFQRTATGLMLRAAAFAPEVSRLLGVRVARMLTLGWALAAGVGAVAGVLIAPSTFVSPNAFDAVLVYGFTAAVIGGLDSPPGALVGGVSLGLALSYIAGYAGPEVVAFGAFVVLLVVLMLRPHGLFSAPARRRI